MRIREVLNVENKRQISAISGAHGVNEFYSVVLPPILPMLVADFEITYGQAGLLMTVFFAMYALFQLPAGVLADRLGQARLLFIGMLVLIAGIFLVTVAQSFEMLLLAQIVAGIGGSTYHPAGMSLISDLETMNTEGRAMGIHGFGGMVGVAAAPALIGGVAALTNWRAALFVSCLLGIVATVILYVSFSDRVGTEKTDAATIELGTEFLSLRSIVTQVQLMFRVPLTSWLALLLVAHVVVSLQVRSVQTFTTTYVFAQGSGSTAVANAAFFVLLVGGSLSSLWIGDLSDRVDRGLLGGIVSVVTAALLLGTIFISADTSMLLLFPWFFAIGVALYAPSPVKNALASAYSKEEFSGSLFGLMQTAAAAGGALGPVLFGLVAERYGEAILYPGIAVVCLITASVFISLRMVEPGD